MTSLVPKPTTGRGAIIELVVIVVLAIGLALGIQAFLVKPFQIPSGSMQPTLDINQRVLVNRLAYRLGEPEVGDIVVFHPPSGATEGGPTCGAPAPDTPCKRGSSEQSDENFIKRIVAGPGDRLRVERGVPIVNGEVPEEDFTHPSANCPLCNLPEEITIPADHYFMMGDNRGASDDSRAWGPVPEDWIIGEAFFTYWPPSRVGLL